MAWEIISRDENPEEWARIEKQFKKDQECEIRGHGQLFVDAEGYVFCGDCEQCLLAGPEDDPED